MKRIDMTGLIEKYSKKYRKAGKKEKSRILDEFTEVTEYNRSYASLILRRGYCKKNKRSKFTKRRGRKKKYDFEVLRKLVEIWEILDFPCGKRFKAIIEEAIENLSKNNHLSLREEIKQKLMEISSSTMDRLLRSERKKMELKGRSHTKPGTLLKKHIRIKTHHEWDDKRPGFVEVDLVGHEGGNSSGEFCYSLNMVDVASGWSIVAPIRNKAQRWTLEAIIALRELLPFPLLGIHSDNGSEFINAHLYKYCLDERLVFTRTRSYNKNDNPHVEQKNWSLVRRAVGYYRYDTLEELSILNELYESLNLYNNHFQPTQKMIQKTRDGTRIVKKYDKFATPYERVLNSPWIDCTKKDELRKVHEALDLYILKSNIAHSQESLVDIQIMKSKSNSKGGVLNSLQLDFE